MAAAASPAQDPGQLAGRAYAANTAGAIGGAVLFSLALIPWLGTQRSQQWLIGLSAIAGFVVLAPLCWSRVKSLGALAASVGICLACIWSVAELPWQAVAYGRRSATLIRTREIVPGMISPAQILYRDEGMNSSLLVTEENGLRVFYVSGKSEASSGSADMRLQRMIGHMPALIHTNPRNVLVANNLAVLLVDYKGDQQSLQKAFSLSRDFEKDAPHSLFLDTLGWVRFKMGQQEEALRLMKDAVAKSPEVPTLNYHLGMALYQSGKTTEARAYLSKALKSAEAFQGRQVAEQILSQMRG